MRASVKMDVVQRVIVPLGGRRGVEFAVRHGVRLAATRRLPLAFVLFASDSASASTARRALSEALRRFSAHGVQARVVVDSTGLFSKLRDQVAQGDLVLLAQGIETSSAMQPFTGRADRLLVLSEGLARN